MRKKNRALVLLSGGIDSSVCAGLAVREFGNDNVQSISINYGQKHDVELDAAKVMSKELGLRNHTTINIDIGETLVSALLDSDRDVPKETYGQGPLSTYVPFRNGILLSVAAGIAYSREIDVVYYGAHLEDSYQGAYPDTTFEFNGAMANAFSFGTSGAVRLVVPLQWMSKREVVEEAIRLQIPLEKTYSCYNGREIHCGRCSTCKSRIEAFKRNNFIDPVEYEEQVDWDNVDIVLDLNKGRNRYSD